MAFPTTSVLDDFNRADGRPITGWSDRIEGANSGLLTISSNKLAVNANGVGESSSAWWNAGTFGPDCEVYATASTLPAAGTPIELYARLQGPGASTVDGYCVSMWISAGTDFFRVYSMTDGVFTQLGADISQEFAAGDSWGMSLVGSTIEVWYKASGGSWTSMGTRTDSTYSSAGYLGAGLWFSAVRVDDFGGGTIAASGLAWITA